MPVLTPSQIAEYHRDGCLMVRGLFSKAEMDTMLQVAKVDRAMTQAGGFIDKDGNISRISLSNAVAPREDIFSAVSCSRRLVDRMTDLMGAEPLHFHHKMMLKDPRVGGAWEWHQDYGYWYKNEKFATPDMVSVFVAADRATKANGCLQVIKGSHRPGRIEHGTVGNQTGADMLFVNAYLERKDMEHAYVEMEQGDAVFFHANTLHRSDKNTSDYPRWTLVCCYTHPDNLPIPVEARDCCKPMPDLVNDADLLGVAQRHLAMYAAPANA